MSNPSTNRPPDSKTTPPATFPGPWSNPEYPGIHIVAIHIPNPDTIAPPYGFIASPDKLVIKTAHVEFILYKRTPESHKPPSQTCEWTIACDEAGAPLTVSTMKNDVNVQLARSVLPDTKEVSCDVSPRRESPPPVTGSRPQDVFLDEKVEKEASAPQQIDSLGTQRSRKSQPCTPQEDLAGKEKEKVGKLPNAEDGSQHPPISHCEPAPKDDLPKIESQLQEVSTNKDEANDELIVSLLPLPSTTDKSYHPPLTSHKFFPPPQPPSRMISGVKCTHPELLALPPHDWDFVVDPKTMRIFYKNTLTGERTYSHPVLGNLPKNWIFRVEKSSEGLVQRIRTVYFNRKAGMGWLGDPRDSLEMARFNAEVLKRECEKVRMGNERVVGDGVERGERLEISLGKSEMARDLKRKEKRARQLAVKFREQVEASSIGGTITLLGVK